MVAIVLPGYSRWHATCLASFTAAVLHLVHCRAAHGERHSHGTATVAIGANGVVRKALRCGAAHGDERARDLGRQVPSAHPTDRLASPLPPCHAHAVRHRATCGTETSYPYVATDRIPFDTGTSPSKEHPMQSRTASACRRPSHMYVCFPCVGMCGCVCARAHAASAVARCCFAYVHAHMPACERACVRAPVGVHVHFGERRASEWYHRRGASRPSRPTSNPVYIRNQQCSK